MTGKKSFRQHLKMVEEKKLNLDAVVMMDLAKAKLVENNLLLPYQLLFMCNSIGHDLDC